MTDKRQSIAAKIRALLAKTVENGCTEDEAIAAAEKAAELLEQYELTLDEVELRANPFKQHQESFEDDVGARLWKCAAAIADLTHTRYWTNPSGEMPVKITFFGFDHEVLIASYLLAICNRAMHSAADKRMADLALFRLSVRRSRRAAFLDGMADTLCRRIRALIRHRESDGKGLVVVRNALLDDELARRALILKDKRARPSRDLDPAYSDGRRAGEQVGLDAGLTEATIDGLLEAESQEDPGS